LHSKAGNEAPLQPLPNDVQEKVWGFVRKQIQRHEDATGAKVAKFEIHITPGGQIEVEVLSTQNERSAAIDEGLEEAGIKDEEVNRITQREQLESARNRRE